MNGKEMYVDGVCFRILHQCLFGGTGKNSKNLDENTGSWAENRTQDLQYM